MRKTYQIYGQLLATDFPFKTPLLLYDGPPDLNFFLVFSEPKYSEWRYKKPVARSQDRLFLYCCKEYDVFHFVEIVDFYVFSDKIICHLLDLDFDYQVEVLLLGLVLSYWLEKHGICALHASAVKVENKSIAFLSTNSGGKTSLAATLTYMGYPLLTDDILPIQKLDDLFIGLPGFPQMRMWPEVAQHFVENYSDLALVHPAYAKRRIMVDSQRDFCSEAIPLKCIYLPERVDTPKTFPEFKLVKPMEAFIILMTYSFAAGYIEAAGLQEERFNFLSGLVQTVPVYKLIYPNGLHLLSDVCTKIIIMNGYDTLD